MCAAKRLHVPASSSARVTNEIAAETSPQRLKTLYRGWASQKTSPTFLLGVTGPPTAMLGHMTSMVGPGCLMAAWSLLGVLDILHSNTFKLL